MLAHRCRQTDGGPPQVFARVSAMCERERERERARETERGINARILQHREIYTGENPNHLHVVRQKQCFTTHDLILINYMSDIPLGLQASILQGEATAAANPSATRRASHCRTLSNSAPTHRTPLAATNIPAIGWLLPASLNMYHTEACEKHLICLIGRHCVCSAPGQFYNSNTGTTAK